MISSQDIRHRDGDVVSFLGKYIQHDQIVVKWRKNFEAVMHWRRRIGAQRGWLVLGSNCESGAVIALWQIGATNPEQTSYRWPVRVGSGWFAVTPSDQPRVIMLLQNC
jgi:hypothetical protein